MIYALRFSSTMSAFTDSCFCRKLHNVNNNENNSENIFSFLGALNHEDFISGVLSLALLNCSSYYVGNALLKSST